MKKIVLLLLLLPSSLYATSFTSWNESLPKDTSNLIIEKSIRYKWYKNIIIDQGYKLYNEEEKDLFDLNNYILGNVKESEKEIESNDYIVILPPEEKRITLDTTLTNSIRIEGFILHYWPYISEVIVYNTKTNKQISIKANSKDKEITGLNNGVFNETIFKTGVYEKVDIMLDDYYNIDDLETKIYFTTSSFENNAFIFKYMKDLEHVIRSVRLNNDRFNKNCTNEYCEIKYDKNTSFSIYNEFYETFYYYQDKLFYYSKIQKQYTDNYYEQKEGYIKDESTKKTFYRYKKIIKNTSQAKKNYKTNNNKTNKENNKDTSDVVIGAIDKIDDNKETALLIEPVITEKESINYGLIYLMIFIPLILLVTILFIIFKKIKSK